jgi:hypothetical protein
MTAARKTAHWAALLEGMHACPDAIEYARGHRTFAAAWRACGRGDWMAWYLQRTLDKRARVGIGAEIAALAEPLYAKRYPNDTCVRDCIEVCRRYARGEASEIELAEVKQAATAAATAAYAAYAAATARAKMRAQIADVIRAHYPKPPRTEP